MRRMLREAGVTRSHTVLEVGPGPGTLTRVLAAKAKRVEAVEVDRQFRPLLDEVTAEHRNVAITWGDAREVDLPAFDLVVASLPYSASLPILFRLMEAGFERGAVLLQDRQARRLAARPGAPGYSRVGVMAQRLATIDVVAHIGRDRFIPEPAVDSALVRIGRRADGAARPLAEPEQLGHVVDTLFLRRHDRLDASMRASGLGDAVGDVPGRLRHTSVDRVTPEEFGVVAAAVAAAGLRVPPVPARVKRRAN